MRACTAGRSSALPAADERRGCGRRRGHGGGRAARRHARTPARRTPGRVVAPAGRIRDSTGIVFALVNLALWWLPLFRRGHLLKTCWRPLPCGFVAAAGFPPSAVHAAMCTVLQAALASASECRWAERPGRGGFRDAGLESQLAGRHQFFSCRSSPWRPSRWACRSAAAAGPVEGRERRRRRLSDPGSWRLSPLRRSFRTRSASCRWPDWRSIRWPSRWPGRGVRRRIVDAAPVGFLAPAFGFVTGSAAEGISALARLTASRCPEVRPITPSADGRRRRSTPFLRLRPLRRGAANRKKRIFADVITPEEYSLCSRTGCGAPSPPHGAATRWRWL